MNKEKPKTLLIRMAPELHKKMKLISVENDCSLNEYVIKAFKQIIEKDAKGKQK